MKHSLDAEQGLISLKISELLFRFNWNIDNILQLNVE